MTSTTTNMRNVIVQYFEDKGIYFHHDENSFNTSFILEKENFLKAMDVMRTDSSFRFLDILAFREEDREWEDILLVYHFFYTESFEHLRIKVRCGEDKRMPSITHLWPCAYWHERELYDSYEIFTAQKPLHLISPRVSLQNYRGASQSKDEGFRELSRDIFPTQLETKARKRLSLAKFNSLDLLENGYGEKQFRLDGKMIAEVKLDLGFEHRGIERLCEGKDVIYPLSRLHYIHTAQGSFFSQLYCHLLESLFRIKTPERAQALRMVVSELVRIQDHLKAFSLMARTLFASSYESLQSTLALEVYSLIQDLCPTRTDSFRYSCPGGVPYDIFNDWWIRCLRTLDFVEKELSSWKKALLGSGTFKDQLSGDALSKEDALRWSLSGPLLRACGINYDRRKAKPYYLYDQLDFEIPLGLYGCGYDRFLVRSEEVRESIKIIYQLLNNLPSGEISAIREGDLVEFFSQVRLSFDQDIYFSHEGPSGELGYYLCLSQERLVRRLKVHTPSFHHAQAFEKFIIGHDVEDVPIIQGSFNFSLGEVER